MVRSFVLAALALSTLAAFACGDGGSAPGTSATATTATSAPRPTTARGSSSPGTNPGPKLPQGNVDAIHPTHGQKVTQASTRTPDPKRPNGVCAQVNFKDLPENGQWFRLVLDGKEVTAAKDITWVLPTDANTKLPEAGTLCYAPKDGLGIGPHQVALGVQNPRNASEPTRQIVEWEFEVTP